jgi:hypothetical protein
MASMMREEEIKRWLEYRNRYTLNRLSFRPKNNITVDNNQI